MGAVTLQINNGIAAIIFDNPDSKVNVLSTDVMMALQNAVRNIKNDSNIRALIIESAKPGTFIAGADIKEIESIKNSEDGAAKATQGQNVFNELEALSIPSVAVIDGMALGGGLELALACSHRFLTFNPKILLGLPEVKLGIIPGFGGTKRLSRAIGLSRALEMILEGKLIDGERAIRWGLVDGRIPEGLIRESVINFLKSNNFKKMPTGKRTSKLIERFLEETSVGRSLIRRSVGKSVQSKTKGKYPAVPAALDTVLANYKSPLNEALSREARVFGSLVVGNVSKNLIKVFYLTERYKKERWTEATGRPVTHAGVLGAGVMGGGIAALFANYSIPVRLKDIRPEAIHAGLKSAWNHFSLRVKRRKISLAEGKARQALISPTLEYTGFLNADLVVEAVLEDMSVKKGVFQELESHVSDHTVIATNTSALRLSEMAKAFKKPERFVGMHFFNPVGRMPLVEVIRHDRASDEAVATVVDFARKIGKTPIVVGDNTGFLVNRILMPFLNEAGYLIEEGGDADAIDKILLDFGMPMGAFVLLDEIGLDVALKVAHTLEDHFGTRMKQSRVISALTSEKLFGKKNGKGFYIHEGKNRSINPRIRELFPATKKISTEDIIARTIYVMVNEAARCLDEKICREPADADLGLIMGIGFPPFRGGLLTYADSVGVSTIVDALDKAADQVNRERLAPCAYLKQMQNQNKKFYG